ncbi:Acetyltransferase (isoleucine patch superfamily) [Prevotella sp. kh1p2]|nr:Acetyltransferase (isoleucine patch superfamily) [Prevotella sp. kh1p2]SNU11839.1 Acetyltransferase (isoleucine patch superfamily) [Prevotellaceae bacterium KH2P17]
MLAFLFKIKNVLFGTQWKYCLTNSAVRLLGSSKLSVGKKCRILHSKITLSNGATLILHDNVLLDHVNIFVDSGFVEINEFSILSRGNNYMNPSFIVNTGTLKLGHHSRLSPYRVWIRYGGKLTIGDYTCVNENSEIRVDDQVSIGSYVGISYYTCVWDTNTHMIYTPEVREGLLRKYFPYFWKEKEKPSTAPVVICDNCWIGEHSSILKGTTLGRNVIVGFNTMVINKEIPDNSKVVQDINLRVL